MGYRERRRSSDTLSTSETHVSDGPLGTPEFSNDPLVNSGWASVSSDGQLVVASDPSQQISLYTIPETGTPMPFDAAPIASASLKSARSLPPLPISISQATKYVVCGGMGAAQLLEIVNPDSVKGDESNSIPTAINWRLELCHGEGNDVLHFPDANLMPVTCRPQRSCPGKRSKYYTQTV